MHAQLNQLSDADWQKVMTLYNTSHLVRGVFDIFACAEASLKLLSGNRSVRVIGFCLGGLLTLLPVARHLLDATAVYGGAIIQPMDEADGVRNPPLAQFDGEYNFVSKPAGSPIIHGSADSPNVDIHHFPDCGHAFARQSGRQLSAEVAEQANGRRLTFLRRHLAAV